MEIVQCDRCGAIVARTSVGKFYYRNPESMADRDGGVMDYDVCGDCLAELTAWIQRLVTPELSESVDVDTAG